MEVFPVHQYNKIKNVAKRTRLREKIKNVRFPNYYFKNLQWITQRENVIKSYETSGMNQFRNYKVYNIIYPDGSKSKDLIGQSGIKNYIKSNDLKCSALSLQKYGYSKNYKI